MKTLTLNKILHISCQGASFFKPAEEYCALHDAAGLCKKSIGLSGSSAIPGLVPLTFGPEVFDANSRLVRSVIGDERTFLLV